MNYKNEIMNSLQNDKNIYKLLIAKYFNTLIKNFINELGQKLDKTIFFNYFDKNKFLNINFNLDYEEDFIKKGILNKAYIKNNWDFYVYWRPEKNNSYSDSVLETELISEKKCRYYLDSKGELNNLYDCVKGINGIYTDDEKPDVDELYDNDILAFLDNNKSILFQVYTEREIYCDVLTNLDDNYLKLLTKMGKKVNNCKRHSMFTRFILLVKNYKSKQPVQDVVNLFKKKKIQILFINDEIEKFDNSIKFNKLQSEYNNLKEEYNNLQNENNKLKSKIDMIKKTVNSD
jgi:hypothetical protein